MCSTARRAAQPTPTVICRNSDWLPQHRGRGLYCKLQAWRRIRSKVQSPVLIGNQWVSQDPQVEELL